MSLVSSLLRLRDESTRLNLATDQASRALQVVEDFLTRANIGVSGSVELDKNTQLSYDRLKGSHRILIEDEASRYPWQEVPRYMKIAAATKLQELVDSLISQVQVQAELAFKGDSAGAVEKIIKAVEELEGKSNAK